MIQIIRMTLPLGNQGLRPAWPSFDFAVVRSRGQEPRMGSLNDDIEFPVMLRVLAYVCTELCLFIPPELQKINESFRAR